MNPIKNGENLVEIDIDSLILKDIDFSNKLDEKYYIVKIDNVYGVYHKYYGFSSEIEKI